MKKFLIFSIVTILVISVAGCGGGGGTSKQAKGYYYEWASGGNSVASASKTFLGTVAKPKDISKGCGIVQAGYISSAIPPFATVSLEDGRCVNFTVIYTYNETIDPVTNNITTVPVDSVYNCPAGSGKIASVNGATAFFPSIRGLTNVTAEWNNQRLTIPIRVYDFLGLNNYKGIDASTGHYIFEGKVAYDFDTKTWCDDPKTAGVDVYIDKKTGRFYTPYGSQTTNVAITLINTAPTDGYNLTEIEAFPAMQNLIIKTSDGKYVKAHLCDTGTSNGWGVGLAVFVSNASGEFEY